MAYETLLYEMDGPVLTVTLNRPDKLNAYTAVMGAELEDAFLRADADDEVRVIIVGAYSAAEATKVPSGCSLKVTWAMYPS